MEDRRSKPPIGRFEDFTPLTAPFGSSKKAHKTYLRMVQNVQLTGFVPKIAQIDNPIIGFSEEDARHFHHPHDDALVVSIQVGEYNTH